MSAGEVRRCRSCAAPIVWAETVNGRRMPVDEDPVENGNIDLELHERDRVTAHYLSAGERTIRIERAARDGNAIPRFFTSHFATCPQRDRWRKKEEKTDG